MLVKNIESRNTSEALALINKLNPVKYNWIDEAKSGHKFEDGFMAQEVEKVLPEAINANAEAIPNSMEPVKKNTLINLPTGSAGEKTVDYSRIFTIGISAIQELSHLNDSSIVDNKRIQSSVVNLNSELGSLKSEVDNLESEEGKIQVDNTAFKISSEAEMAKLKAVVENLVAESNLETKN